MLSNIWTFLLSAGLISFVIYLLVEWNLSKVPSEQIKKLVIFRQYRIPNPHDFRYSELKLGSNFIIDKAMRDADVYDEFIHEKSSNVDIECGIITIRVRFTGVENEANCIINLLDRHLKGKFLASPIFSI